MDAKRLRQIEERLQLRTNLGDWKVDRADIGDALPFFQLTVETGVHGNWEADAALIVNAPADLRYLLDVIYSLLPIVDDACRDAGLIPQDTPPSMVLLARVAKLEGALQRIATLPPYPPEALASLDLVACQRIARMALERTSNDG